MGMGELCVCVCVCVCVVVVVRECIEADDAYDDVRTDGWTSRERRFNYSIYQGSSRARRMVKVAGDR